MSDGDNATPGRRRPDPPGDDNPWLTRSSPPMPGSAPWERASGSIPVPSGGGHAAEEPGEEPAAGHHSDSVSVAELIAKVSGNRPEEQPRRRAAPPPTPPPPLPAYAQS